MKIKKRIEKVYNDVNKIGYILLIGLVSFVGCEKQARESAQLGDSQISSESEYHSELTDLFEKLIRQKDYVENLYAVNQWNSPLSDGDIRYLNEFIQGAKPSSLSTSQFAELINDALNLLHRNSSSSDELTPVLIEMALDNRRDDIYCDYAIQHMVHLFSTCSPSNAEKIEQTLKSLIEDSDSSLAGTALYSFSAIVMPIQDAIVPRAVSRNFASLDKDQFEQWCVSILKNENESASLQSAALNILHRAGNNSVLECARNFLGNENLDAYLQRACIGILAEWGNPDEDLPILESINTDSASMSRTLNYAIQRLNSKS